MKPGSDRILPPPQERGSYQFRTAQRHTLALIGHGSLGDNLALGAVANALRDRFPDVGIHVLARTAQGLVEHPAIDSLEVCPAYPETRIPALRGRYRLVVDVRYWPKTFLGRNPADDLKAFHREAKRRFAAHPGWYAGFPKNAQEVSGEWQGHVLELMSEALGLTLTPAHLSVPNVTTPAGLPRHYVTVNNFCMRARQTKIWDEARWGEVCRWLSEDRGIPVLHIGKEEEAPIPNTINMRGKALGESAGIIQGAICHLSPEGGTAWIAAAVRTPAVTLFGPTPVHFFAFPTTVPVVSSACSPCWWRSDDWMWRCSRDNSRPKTQLPPCMDALSVEAVIDAIKGLA